MDKREIGKHEIAKNEDTYLEVYNKQETFRKSNYLINATYNSSIMENKIMALALLNIKNNDGTLKSELPASYIRSLMGLQSSGSFYERLFITANEMTSKKLFAGNEKNEFDIINLTKRASYKSGVFTIIWNEGLEQYIYNLSKNFSIMNISIIMSFKTNYAYRLYELLHSRAYNHKGINMENTIFEIEYSLSELKMKLGYIDITDSKLQNALLKSASKNQVPDYQLVATMAEGESKKGEWREFNRRALSTAVNEINNNPTCDITVKYTRIKGNPGGKTIGVKFIVDRNKNNEEFIQQMMSTEQKYQVIKEVESLFKGKLSLKDITSIVDTADYDINKVKKAREVLFQTPNVKNVTKFMIKAIKDDYDPPSPVSYDDIIDFETIEETNHEKYLKWKEENVTPEAVKEWAKNRKPLLDVAQEVRVSSKEKRFEDVTETYEQLDLDLKKLM